MQFVSKGNLRLNNNFILKQVMVHCTTFHKQPELVNGQLQYLVYKMCNITYEILDPNGRNLGNK